MMASFGHGTRRHPRTRGRMGSQWGSPRASRFEVGGGPDRATLGIIGLVCAVAGFFVLGIVLGPVAIVCGWLAMGRSWAGSRSVPAVVAVVLGAIDTLLAVIMLAGAATWGNGMF
ncbi:small hydrophobic protein [Streptomyces sp. NPDC014603]|uniref:small hydrophobic protein n=1 Tax=unclassified Streptomyces TaxID=2593676 RepID=UPI003626B01D